MKRRFVRMVQKYLLNPPNQLMLAMNVVPPGRALLETTGRKSGKPRRTPIGDGRVGNQLWIVAEHGMESNYVRNIVRDPRVRVKVRDGLRVHWLLGTAHVLPDDDPRERQRWLAEQRPGSKTNSAIVRLLGTSLLTVRIDLEENGKR